MKKTHQTIIAVALTAAWIVAISVMRDAPVETTSDLYLDEHHHVSELFTQTDTGCGDALDIDASRIREITFSVYDRSIFDGRTTSSGEPYRHVQSGEPFSCASNDYPIGTYLLCAVGDPARDYRDLLCRVNDRMATRFTGKRVDLSGSAMAALNARYDLTDATAGILSGRVAVLTDEEVICIIGRERFDALGGGRR